MSPDDVRRYLARYGYLRPEARGYLHPEARARLGLPRDVPAGDDDLDDATVDALRAFQGFYRLPMTGQLDEVTVALMSRPRCGVPDVGPLSRRRRVDEEPFRQSSTATDEDQPQVRGFVPTSDARWTHRDLTYQFAAAQPYVVDLSVSAVRAAIADAFSKWAPTTDPPFSFTLIDALWSSGQPTPDIIGSAVNTGPSGVLAYASGPPTPPDTPPYADFVFVDSWTWQVTPVAPGNYDLTRLAIHEIGHVLGLSHSSVTTSMMYATTGDGDQPHNLDPDDIAGMQYMYPAESPPPPSGEIPALKSLLTGLAQLGLIVDQTTP